MSRVLLATHGGPSADGAVRVASLLAERLRLPRDIIAVISAPPVVDGGYGLAFVPSWPQRRDLAADLESAVRAQLARCGVAPDGAPAIEFGPIASTIADRAEAAETAALVVGLGAHQLADRALGDETALRLAHIAAVPVLAVPADARALPRRAIAATDFSPSSAEAARTAARWIATGGTLYLAHAMPASGEADAGDRLADFARTLSLPEGVRAEPMLLQGAPARALLELAERTECELIALGSHGYGAVRRLLLGSVASKLLRHSPRPVLVVPAGYSAEARPVRAGPAYFGVVVPSPA